MWHAPETSHALFATRTDASVVLVLLAYALLAAVNAVLVRIDLEKLRLPNVIVLPAIAAFGLLLVAAAAVDGEHESLARSLSAGVVLTVFYGVLWLLQPGGIGAGDVKLAALLGLALGWVSWQAVLTGALAASAIGGALGLALMRSKNARGPVKLPFGPPMIAGTWFAIALG
jgi:leader peptidase (prepilin peptidase)/N-methyltransferase